MGAGPQALSKTAALYLCSEVLRLSVAAVPGTEVSGAVNLSPTDNSSVTTARVSTLQVQILTQTLQSQLGPSRPTGSCYRSLDDERSDALLLAATLAASLPDITVRGSLRTYIGASYA